VETIATIPHGINNYYDRNMLRRAVPLLLHTRFAQIRDIPRNMTNVIKFRKYGNLAAATTPLTEGVTPAGSSLAVTDVTATVRQYGDFIKITDYLELTTLDPILMETSGILGDQAGLTLDTLTRNILAAGTSVQYVDNTSPKTNAARGDIVAEDKMSVAGELDIAIRTLKGNKARKLTQIVRGDLAYATAPVNACYVAIIHPDTTYDLSGLTGWVPVEKYANKADVMDGEVGAYKEVRFIETTEAKVFEGEGGGGIDVYATLIFGADAYGISRISGAAMENIVKAKGSAGTADPLNQRSTSGWKASFAAVILNQLFMLRLEHSVS